MREFARWRAAPVTRHLTMKPFEFFSPTALSDAARMLADYNGEGRALAGGTDLLIRMKRRQWTPRAVVSLNRVGGLDEIALNGELRLGARATLNQIIRSKIVREYFPALAETARGMAGVQVRSLATVGGNLCNAAPSADMAPPLIALNARAVIVGVHGERVVPLDEFFTGPGKSVLQPGEILRELLAPRPHENMRASYTKLEHRAAMDIAMVGVSVSVQIENPKAEIKNCADVRIVLGAVAPIPLRAKRAEEILRGQPLSAENIAHAARVAAEEAKPIDDVRSSAWYRREMVEVLTRRQLQRLAETA